PAGVSARPQWSALAGPWINHWPSGRIHSKRPKCQSRKRPMRQWRIIVLIAASLAASASTLTPLAAEDRTQARSMVISQYGIVAAEQPIAARAGTAILERGGNAIDAAVAANAAMGLVAPMMNGIGGDLFAIVYEARTNKIYGLNASGWA